MPETPSDDIRVLSRYSKRLHAEYGALTPVMVTDGPLSLGNDRSDRHDLEHHQVVRRLVHFGW